MRCITHLVWVGRHAFPCVGEMDSQLDHVPGHISPHVHAQLELNTDPSEVRGRLDLPHRLHQRVAHRNADIRAGVSVRAPREVAHVALRQVMRRVAQVQLEHVHARRLIGQRDVDPLLEPATPRVVLCQNSPIIAHERKTVRTIIFLNAQSYKTCCYQIPTLSLTDQT